jgi:dihydrofolate reductase
MERVAEVRKLKQESGNDMVILGSGCIVSQLADAGLADQYQLVPHPIMLAKGRRTFEGVTKRQVLELTCTPALSKRKHALVLQGFESVRASICRTSK